MKRAIYIFFVLLSSLLSCIREDSKGADLETGDRLPDFEIVMNDGSVVSDESLKGSVSVIVFFNTLCPDCQKELPIIQDIYDEYVLEGVSFALVSREEGADSIEPYWRENGLYMPYSAQNDRRVYERFARSRIPRIYINDKDGIIRYIYTDDPVPSYSDLKSSLESVIR